MSKVLGIDLGTTNSCAVVMEGGTPQVIPNDEGYRTTPTIVAFTSKGEALVGQIAKRQALKNPENTIFGFLRFLGRPFESEGVQAAQRTLPYELVAGDDGLVRIRMDDRDVSPTELSAIVLQKLKTAAEGHLREPVGEAILTVPNSFTDRQREELENAATLAGLNANRTLSVSTAAALAYALTSQRRGIVAVYDLGGGHCNVSIAQNRDGVYQVLSSGGDPGVGGADFDRLIVEELLDEFLLEEGIDLTGDRMALQRLKEAAERAKCELSTRPQAEIALPFLSADSRGPKHLNTTLTRERFEELLEPWLDRTVNVCRQALADAGLTLDDVEEVIPVGGQSRTPIVLQTVKRFFRKEPRRDVNPDEVVAIGAAIQTGILQGEVTDLAFLDVTPHALGIDTPKGGFLTLVERSTNIPTRVNRLCEFVADDKGVVVVRFLQGESERSRLGEWRLTDVAWRPKRAVALQLTVEMNFNGFIQVTARDAACGRSASWTLPGDGPSEPVRLQEALARPEQPQSRESEPEQLRGQLVGLIVSTRKTLELLYGKLTREERAESLLALQAADEAADGTLEEMQKAQARLEVIAEALGRAMLRG